MRTRVTIQCDYSKLPDTITGKKQLMERPKVIENGWIHVSPNFPNQMRIIVGDDTGHDNVHATLYHCDPLYFGNRGKQILVTGQEIVDYVHGFKIPVTWFMEYLEET